MIVQCDGCQARFRLRDDRVTQEGVRLRCTKCQRFFWAKKEVPQSPFEGFGAAPLLSDEETTRPARLDQGAKPSKVSDGALFDARWDSDESAENDPLLDVPDLRDELFDRPKKSIPVPEGASEAQMSAPIEKQYRAPTFQRRTSYTRIGSPLFHGFMVVVWLGVGAWVLRERHNPSSEWTAFFSPETLHEDFEVSNVASNVVETRAGRMLWVVTGVAHARGNDGKTPEVTIEIWHSGRVLKKAQGLLSPPPTPQTLNALETPHALKAIFQQAPRGLPAESGDSFFWAVFDALPADLKDATVKVRARHQG